MSKYEFKSQVLKSKAANIITKTNEQFYEKAKKYDYLNNKKQITSAEKKEKVHLKDYISQEISYYKKNPQNWIQTNAPSGVKESIPV